MENITLKTIELIDKCFAAPERELALSLIMDECGNNLPFFEQAGPADLERVRFAAIKFSDGDINRLKSAIEIAKADWRDLLPSVDFACDIKLHPIPWLLEKLNPQIYFFAYRTPQRQMNAWRWCLRIIINLLPVIVLWSLAPQIALFGVVFFIFGMSDYYPFGVFVSKENVIIMYRSGKTTARRKFPLSQIKAVREAAHSQRGLFDLENINYYFRTFTDGSSYYGHIIRGADLELYDGRHIFVGFEGVEKFVEVLNNLLVNNYPWLADKQAGDDKVSQ